MIDLFLQVLSVVFMNEPQNPKNHGSKFYRFGLRDIFWMFAVLSVAFYCRATYERKSEELRQIYDVQDFHFAAVAKYLEQETGVIATPTQNGVHFELPGGGYYNISREDVKP